VARIALWFTILSLLVVRWRGRKECRTANQTFARQTIAAQLKADTKFFEKIDAR